MRRYIGNRAFYRSVFAIAIPMIIQNGITNFVSLLDNIMVGQLGTPPMSGVSVVNQFIFVFNLCIFGANSGAGIFTAQFFGSGDHTGVRHTFRFKILCCAVIGILGVGGLALFGEPLIRTFLQGEGTPEEIHATLAYGKDYLSVIVWGLIPFAINGAYAGTLRECGQTKVPMAAGVTAVFVNLIFNWLLIFGNLGLPQMGVRGAALATVLSRYVELAIVMIWTHRSHKKHPFIRGAYRSLHIPGKLLGQIALKGSPLLINEILWSVGITFMNQCYSTCGLNVVSATNITSTISSLTSVVTMALGNTIGIIMGQMLGAAKPGGEVRDANRKLTALSVFMGIIFGTVLASVSWLFPRLYNTAPEVRSLATQLILIVAVMLPFNTYMYAGYYTLRSGGKTWVTFAYDSGFLWLCPAPLLWILTRYTGVAILPLYMLGQGVNLIKCVIGGILIHLGKWVQNLTTK